MRFWGIRPGEAARGGFAIPPTLFPERVSQNRHVVIPHPLAGEGISCLNRPLSGNGAAAFLPR